MPDTGHRTPDTGNSKIEMSSRNAKAPNRPFSTSSVHSSYNNSDVEYSSIPHIALPGSAPIHPGSTNLHMLFSIAYIVRSVPIELVLDRFYCITTSTSTARRTLPNQPPRPTSLYGADWPFLRTIVTVQSCASSESSGCSFLGGWLTSRWCCENHRISFQRMTKVEG